MDELSVQVFEDMRQPYGERYGRLRGTFAGHDDDRPSFPGTCQTVQHPLEFYFFHIRIAEFQMRQKFRHGKIRIVLDGNVFVFVGKTLVTVYKLEFYNREAS